MSTTYRLLRSWIDVIATLGLSEITKIKMILLFKHSFSIRLLNDCHIKHYYATVLAAIWLIVLSPAENVPMPRYFIDIQESGNLHRDEIGEWCLNLGELQANIAKLLPEIAKGRLRDVEHREFLIAVRDERGSALYRASLTFQAEWYPSGEYRLGVSCSSP